MAPQRKRVALETEFVNISEGSTDSGGESPTERSHSQTRLVRHVVAQGLG